MPLLKKKPFPRVHPPENLSDDDKVFHCTATNEIFQNYEDFSERMFLCNSMVWTCSMTGKSNLTYAEAAESEEQSLSSLKEFSNELKLPVLYVASKTKRTGFGEMAEDVFFYVRDRYFIGELIETTFSPNKWKDSYIRNVILSQNHDTKNGSLKNGQSTFSPQRCKYEVEHYDTKDDDVSEIMIANFNQIKRRRSQFSRERCKLFLKQHVEQDSRGIFVIKKSTVEAYKLDEIKFTDIFAGAEPEFDASRRFEKVVNGKKIRQESLHKFLTKGDAVKKENHNNNGLLEKMRQKREQMRLLKQQKKEEALTLKLKRKEEIRQKKKEERIAFTQFLNAWNKPQEDLELIDHKKLPINTPVESKISDEHFGDVLMIMEFAHSFSKVISTKDFFPGGLTLDIMERALTENEVAGPLLDLIQMLLTAIFNLQESEASQCKTEVIDPKRHRFVDFLVNRKLLDAVRFSTVASKWSQKFQGLPLHLLPLYSLTTSEILRLHLLGSGSVIHSSGAKWRYQQRGGYTNEDDPGLQLRLQRPHIVKSLATRNVVELTVGEKLEILSCLMNQVLTYADVRDIIDERIEKVRMAKAEIRLLVVEEKKKKHEYIVEKTKLNKQENSEKVAKELERLQFENGKKMEELQDKLEQLRKDCNEGQVLMGRDRAYRSYLKLDCVPGFFAATDENCGTCLDRIVKQDPNLANGSRDEILKYLKKIMSEKEEDNHKQEKINGVHNGVYNGQHNDVHLCSELFLCSADPETCVVHKKGERKWYFYHDIHNFNDLIGSLNTRGIRESKLHKNLSYNKDKIENLIIDTPVDLLNCKVVKATNDTEPKPAKKSLKLKYENANMGYSLDMNPEDVLHSILVEILLEIEEKIYAGNLGWLCVKDREKWRSDLQNRRYNDMDKTLKYEIPEANLSDQTGSESLEDLEDECLNLLDFKTDVECKVTPQSDEIRDAVKGLTIALTQIGQSVELRYLKKPLGRIGVNKRNNTVAHSKIHAWQKSLLAATSFSQIFLHYGTLDSCVLWSRSVLLARCKICRRQSDAENMLLCYSCNWGHHLYCLKPKLKAVPPGDWYCNKCKQDKEIEITPPQLSPRKRRIFKNKESDESESSESSSDSESENESNGEMDSARLNLCKTCGSGGDMISCEKCSRKYHIECHAPPLRRHPRGLWWCSSCKKKAEKRRSDSNDDEVVSPRYTRRAEGKIDLRSDLPLHNAALQDVLSEIMKDNNAWPFLRPVQKAEVPDYYDVITKPMDFGTIKYKLNMGEYQEDAQFMADAVLIFQNCNTYNHTDDDVYKCGVELQKHFQKKCVEMGLKLPPELEFDESENPRKKIRVK